MLAEKLRGIAACFGCFGRFDSSTTTPPDPSAADSQSQEQLSGYQKHEPPSSPFHDKAREIAQIPVSGMNRTPGPGQTSCFISSYQPAPSKGPNAAEGTQSGAKGDPAANAETDTTDDTLVGSTINIEKKDGYGHDTNKSTWQGKPNGTVYDRRTELTEEDEDTWARMAM